MSTRTPFFSSDTRQESRANEDQQGSVDDQFTADKSNGQDTLMDASAKERGNVDKLPSETDTHGNPLNVNGLIRSRTRSKPTQRIPLSGGNIPRPGTADPNIENQSFDVHTTTIAAPTPFKASRVLPPLLLNASGTAISSRSVSPLNFKTPAPSMHQSGDIFSSNAHIYTNSDSSRSGDANTAFRSLSGGRSGPGRILKVNNDCNNLNNTTQKFPAQQYIHGKRKENETDKTDRPEKHLKRFKSENSLFRTDISGDKSQGDQSLSGSCVASSGPEYGWGHPPRDASGVHRRVVDNEADSDLKYQRTEIGITNVQQDLDESGGVLEKILGRNVDPSLEEYLLDKYERACNRWRGCTLEEWSAGAEEIKAKYLKIFDFVKDHVNAKVDLYASLGKKLEQHGSILAEREEMLSEARARMIKDSEGVLGKTLGM